MLVEVLAALVALVRLVLSLSGVLLEGGIGLVGCMADSTVIGQSRLDADSS